MSIARKLTNPCGRTSLRLDIAMWLTDARYATADLIRQHILKVQPYADRTALTPSGQPLYGKRTLRNPTGYLH